MRQIVFGYVLFVACRIPYARGVPRISTWLPTCNTSGMRVLTVSLLLSFPMVASAQAQIIYDPLVPLTSEQKAARRVKQLISPMNQLGVAVSSAVGQWSGVPHAWGQGAEGYARRFGSAEGIVTTNNAIGLTSDIIFHIDPRYRRMPEAPTKARVWN